MTVYDDIPVPGNGAKQIDATQAGRGAIPSPDIFSHAN
jgi:hypothetical protein